MNKIIRKIKALFGVYQIGYEYSVPIDDIRIKIEFLSCPPNLEKLAKKYQEYKSNKGFTTPIILDGNFELVDGYCTYLLAKRMKKKYVDVYFVD